MDQTEAVEGTPGRPGGRAWAGASLALLVRALLPLAALLAGDVTPGSAQQIEEILAYDVTIDVAHDATLLVTERIQVRALGDEIRRGIYRDFPTSFPRSSGLGRIVAPFRVVGVQRDGHPEPYSVQSIGGPFGRGGVRVRIGRTNVFLDHGVHDYTIEYETLRWVAFQEAADRLYWNVTGNGWGFPIRSASAVVRVAGLTAEPGLASWTGPEGSTEQNAEQEWDARSGEARFATTTPLGRREGLTIEVTVPKGVLTPPSADQAAEWFWLDWGGYVDGALVLALIIGMYLVMWLRVGVDPPTRPVVVRYDPPEGFSPAALGYLERRGYHPSQLTAALVSMAVKGAVDIERTRKKWRVRATGREDGLSPEEQRVLHALLGRKTEILLSQRHHEKIRKAIKGLRSRLRAQLEKTYFLTNRRWFTAGLLLSLLGFAVLVWRARFGIAPDAWFVALWLTIWSAAVGTMLWRAVTSLHRGLSGRAPGAIGEGVFMTLFMLPFMAAEVGVGYWLLQMVPTHLPLAAVAIGVTNVAFYHLLERPTLRGRGVLDELEGFRSFIAAADQDRLDRLTPPERTPELFERFLPHAIALGLENRWAEQFTGSLTPATATGNGALAWYHGGAASFDASSFATSLGSNLSSTLSSSSSPPGGSGGGGGGGGSSGGGGGGGGGGGW